MAIKKQNIANSNALRDTIMQGSQGLIAGIAGIEMRQQSGWPDGLGGNAIAGIGMRGLGGNTRWQYGTLRGTVHAGNTVHSEATCEIIMSAHCTFAKKCF